MESKRYIDWHMHTKYSDGVNEPEELVRSAKLLGMDSIAITDHDIMTGYWKARPHALEWNLDLVPGVEVSTEIYHILGLGVQPGDARFQSFLKKVQGLQAKVCEQRIGRLHKAGFPISLEKLHKHFPESRLGKYNVFMTLLKDPESAPQLTKRYPDLSPYQIFKEILGSKGIAGNVGKEYFVTSQEAIEEIHAAGGLAIVAHPFKQADSPNDLDSLIAEGLDGLEIQPNYAERNDPYKDYAVEKDLLVTYGSDYHGPCFPRQLLSRGENLIDTEKFFERRSQYGNKYSYAERRRGISS